MSVSEAPLSDSETSTAVSPSVGDRSSRLPPPSLVADGGPADDDEALRRMMERMATHRPAAPAHIDADDDPDDDGDETWHDALEEDDREGELKDEALLSSDQLETCLAKSTALKTTANALFLSPSQPPSTNIASALSTYLTAISSLPPRPPTPPSAPAPAAASSPSASAQPTDDAPRIEEITEEEADLIERGETDDERIRREVTAKVKELRAMLWGNVAACYLKLGQNKEAVEACTESLLDSPLYIKALHRRLTANLAIDTWSSLTSAQEDLNLLLPLLPQPSSSSRPSPLLRELQNLAKTLPGKIQEKQDKEKDEMIDKLKGLGNSVLGKFGLSTDNFKFEPNGAGGYSMNFVR